MTLLDNIVVSRGRSVFSFSMASRATWTDADGNLRMAYEDEPRFYGARWLSENLLIRSDFTSWYHNDSSGNSTWDGEEAYLEDSSDYIQLLDGFQTFAGREYIIGINLEGISGTVLQVAVNDGTYFETTTYIPKTRKWVYLKFTATGTKADSTIFIHPLSSVPIRLQLHNIFVALEVQSSNTSTYVCLGDSTTSSDYPVPLAEYLPDATIYDRGVGGDKLADMLARFSTDVVALNPDYVCILGGINDILLGTPIVDMKVFVILMANLAVMNNITPVLMSILPFGDYAGWTQARQDVVDEFNLWLQEYAATNGYMFIDTYSCFVLDDSYSFPAEASLGDGLHYNSIGSDIIGFFVGSILGRDYPQYVETGDYLRNLVTMFDTDGSMLSTCKGVMIEPQMTNKCECEGVNPVDTTGLTLSGDVASTLTVVDDSTEIAAAGLDKLCISGMVYKLDNSGGSTDANADIDGTVGNLNDHTLSVYARITDATGDLGLTSVSGQEEFSGSSYAIYTILKTPTDAAQKIRIRADAGGVIYFILPQLEESPVVTSYIPTDGTAGGVTRAQDILTFPVGDGVNFRQAEGTLYCEWMPLADSIDVSGVNGILTPDYIQDGLLYNDGNGSGRIRTYDATYFSGISADWSAGDTIKLVSRWSSAGLQLTRNGVSDAVRSYDGAFTFIDNLQIGYESSFPFCIKNLKIYDHDKGQAWAEEVTA